MQVEHDELGMAWVGVRVVGPVDANLHAVLLDEVPGTAKGDWAWDGTGMPDRELHPGEVVYSAIIDLGELQ